MSSQHDIAQQFLDGGVVPADLVGQQTVSKVYVDSKISSQNGEIAIIASLAATAQNTANTGVSAAGTAQSTANTAVGAAGLAKFAAETAQATVDTHKVSTKAHDSLSITYSGPVAGASSVKQAIDLTKQRVDNIVASGGTSNIEIVDARQPATGEAYPVLGARLNNVDAQLADMVINVKSFGAIGDGINNDCVPIQAAIDLCASRGGGTVFIPSGTYLLGTVRGTNSALLYARNKVNIAGVGSSSVLLVKSGLNDPGKYFNVISVPTRSASDAVRDCIFKDFVIDCNGVNNLMPVGEYAKENNGIQLWHGQNIIIDNVDMRNNPGLQCIRLGTDTEHDFKKVRIKNCNFEDVGTAVPGNVNQIDHSTIYFSGSDLIIDNCIFSNKIRPLNNATCAIEIHSDTTIVVNCIIDNYSVGIITAAETADIFDVRYSNNIMKRMTTGFQFWLTSAVSMRDIVLDNNTVESLYSIGNALDCGPMNYPGENITLRGNTFKCTDNITANVANGVSIRNFKNIVIDGDVVKGFMADGIMVEPIDGVTNLQILNTGIEDCGRSTVIGENYGISLVMNKKFNIVSINHNRIKNNGTQYMRNGIVSNCDAVSYDFLGNEVTNIPLDPGGLSRDITLTAVLTGTVRIEHTGNGSPMDFIKASIGSKWADRVNRVRYTKNAGDNLISGWVNERGIYDSGSNANGHYIMFDDGTMECYHTKFVSSLAINTAIGSVFMSGDANWTFPVPFAVITCSPEVVPAYAGLYAWGSVQGGSLSALAFRIISPVALTSAVDIRLKAIGRWK